MTNLGVALGLQTIQNSHGVHFVTAHEFIEDLRKAYNKQRLDRRLRIYRAPKVLIIDEIGSTPWTNSEPACSPSSWLPATRRAA